MCSGVCVGLSGGATVMLLCGFLALFLPLVHGRQLEAQPQGNRIVGGVAVSIQQFPYQLAMIYQGRLRCGAAIISDKFAVSAAHCVKGVSFKDVVMRAGSSISLSGGTTHPATALLLHDKYNPDTTDYDVSIVSVSVPFTFDGTHQPVPLAKSGLSLVGGSFVTVSGWGTLSEGGAISSKLQAVSIPVVPWDTCNKQYADVGGISKRMFCAGVAGRDSCQGDSGGPVVFGETLVGVVSWGVGCARPNYPGVYTELSNPEIRQWIKTKTGV